MHGLETRYVGGLLVAETSMDERQVHADLQRLDDRLFLDKDLDRNTGVVFYSVKYHRGDQPPDLILDWRDEHGHPKPLSSGVGLEVRRMMAGGTIEEKIAAMRLRQAELDEQKRQAAVAGYEAVAKDWERYESPVRSGVLRRGLGLRRSRDKQRSRGRKV